jgi:tetratricopeptide (TPR) repeat protein
MNTDQPSTESNEKKGNGIKIAVIAVLLLLPLIFLFIKFSSSTGPAEEKVATNAPVTIDVAGYENAAKANPNYDNLINLSNAYINTNNAGKSIDPLLKAIELNPNSAIAYNNLGVAYTMVQQYNKGIEYCMKSLQIDSTFQLAKNNLKWATSERDNIMTALEKQNAIPEKDRNTQFYINYGLNYIKIGKFDKSIEAFSKILELEPNSIVAYNNIGTAYMMENKIDEGVAAFKKAVEIDHNDQLSKNNLAWGMSELEKKKKGQPQ